MNPLLSLHFSSAGKGLFMTSKAKNMCQRNTVLAEEWGGGGGISHSWRYLYSSILSTNWPKSIFYTSKQRIFRTKSAFATRANLVTKVVEVVNFPCWVRKSRIRTEAHKKLLACSVSKGTGSQNLNKVIRENSCVYFLFFCIYLLFLWGSAWITTCVFCETAYLILITLQAVAAIKKCCFKR